MTTVTGLTAAKMLELADANIVDAAVVGDDLHLTTRGGDTINAGNCRGGTGPVGPAGPVSEEDVINYVDFARLKVFSIIESSTDDTIDSERGAFGTPVAVTDFEFASSALPAGRCLQISFQIAVHQTESTETPMQAKLEIVRNDTEVVCVGFATEITTDQPVIVNAMRIVRLPSTGSDNEWTGLQTFTLKLTRFVDYPVIVKNSAVQGSMSFVDLGWNAA